MFEVERKRAEDGKRGAMRAFTASQSDSDSNLSQKLQWKQKTNTI